jgi:hypothetical protein
MNTKTATILFLLLALVSCTTKRLTEEEKEDLARDRMYSIDPSFRR